MQPTDTSELPASEPESIPPNCDQPSPVNSSAGVIIPDSADRTAETAITQQHSLSNCDTEVSTPTLGTAGQTFHNGKPWILNKSDSTTSLNSWKMRIMEFGPVKRITSSLEERSIRPRPWETTVIRFGPLSGIFAMCLAFASIVASCGVLAGSNGQAVTHWGTPPSTYLAIFTAIANLSMRYAAIQGVVIAWWTRASRGSTLAKLHWDLAKAEAGGIRVKYGLIVDADNKTRIAFGDEKIFVQPQEGPKFDI